MWLIYPLALLFVLVNHGSVNMVLLWLVMRGCRLKKGKRWVAIDMNEAKNYGLPLPPMKGLLLLSAMQADGMMMKHDCKLFLVNVICTAGDGSVNTAKTNETLKDYESGFEDLPKELPSERGNTHTIHTADHAPVSRSMCTCRQYWSKWHLQVLRKALSAASRLQCMRDLCKCHRSRSWSVDIWDNQGALSLRVG